MDTELFELCKEVYETTGWEGYEMLTAMFEYLHEWNSENVRSSVPPLYTSDYLLEKLPYKIKNRAGNFVGHYLELCPVTPNGVKGWRATYTNEPYTQYAETPLKALLKLTIALHEAGELKAED